MNKNEYYVEKGFCWKMAYTVDKARA